MADKQFTTLAIEFETLQRELRQTNDPGTRKAFLTEIRAKLRELDDASKIDRGEPSEN